MRLHRREGSRPATAAEWMAQLRAGELGPTQKAALADWLRESPLNVRELIESTLLDQDLRGVKFSREQVDEWVQEVRDAPPIAEIESVRGQSDGSDSPPAWERLRRWSIAASLALIVLAGAGFWHWQDGRYATDLGEQRTLTLADGSVVTLNTSSIIKVDFSKRIRSIRLIEGEAFFRVAHDTNRPFDVTARDATVRAVGTQFNVRLAPQTTLVSVVDGVVDVRQRVQPQPTDETAPAGQIVRLRKGEGAKVEASTTDGAEVSRIQKTPDAAPSRSAAWTRGRVEFEGTPLIDVLREFQRYRRFEVDVAEPLRQMRLTGSFDAHDLESALAYIATLPGVVVETTGTQSFAVRQR